MAVDEVEQNGVSLTIPEGCYYVLGDNVQNSYDSRYWKDPFVREDEVVENCFSHSNMECRSVLFKVNMMYGRKQYSVLRRV